jgi:hypothetical protein
MKVTAIALTGRTLLSGEYVQIAKFSTKKYPKLEKKHHANVDINIASFVGRIGVKLTKYAANR